MPRPDPQTIRKDLLTICAELREDWEYTGEITSSTGLFKDLQFESIDAVALGSAIEEHYDQSLPFAEFLMKANERKAADITVGELIEFLALHLRPTAESSA